MGILGVPATTNQAICHLVFDPSRCRTEFAFHCLRLQVDQLVSMGKGGAQPNINQQIIKAYPLMLPPVEEQNRFVGAVTQVRKIRQAAESHLAKLDTLFASLQSRAFRGEL
jgi:type I restriction enzyme S subunit